MNLADFKLFLEGSPDKRDFHILKALSLIMMYHKKHRGKITKDEESDLLMDLITQSYEAYDSWKGGTVSEYCSYLYFKLMDWEKTILTKYSGIKVSRSDFRKAKQRGEAVILKKVNYESSFEN
ncbi:MAG: hypothetical protein ACRCZ9_03910 [Fusobacteriaceae bacterium]